MAAVLPELLAILVCPEPACRAPLTEAGNALVCSGCARRYRVEDRWPVLIPEEAERPE